MLRVFKIQENDTRLTAKQLKEFEIEALFRSFEERKKSRVLRSRQQSMEQLNPAVVKKEEEEEDAVCPICQDDMKTGGEKLTGCSYCHNQLHQHCMNMWMENGENVFCPLCRSAWVPYTKTCQEQVMRKTSYQHYAPSPYHAPNMKPRMSFSNLHNNNNSNSNNSSLATSSGYHSSTVSRTSDTLHMLEQRGSPEDIPLPKAEPIPQQHWSSAQHWITYYGRDLVSCLLSRDWVNREIGLRRLAREVVRTLETGHTNTGDLTDRAERAWRCCTEMLATMIEDKVYKVYLAAVRATKALCNFLSCRDEYQLSQIRSQMRPIVQSILVKCADGNKRISELSAETLFQMCQGQHGEYHLKNQSSCSPQDGLFGVDFILERIVLEERDIQSVSWQWIMGRMVLLEKLIKDLPEDFSLDNKNRITNFSRLMKIIEFTFLNLASSHVNVCKIARKVFILAARNTASDNETFNQVWNLLDTLDHTLGMRMKKKLTTAIEEYYTGNTRASNSTSSSIDDKCMSPQEQDRRAFMEEFLRECSNQHTEPSQPILVNHVQRVFNRPPLIRSTSHSPSRQMSLSRSSSQSPSRAIPRHKKPFCQSVLNINQQTNKKPFISPNKPRNNISYIKSKAKMKDIAREILPNMDFSFLSDSKHESLNAEVSNVLQYLFRVMRRQNIETLPLQNDPCQHQNSFTETREDSVKRNNLEKSSSQSRVHNTISPRSPASVHKKYSASPATSQLRSPVSSPVLGRGPALTRDMRSVSCKDNFDYEDSLALAMALSKSIYHETPLPVIPGLSYHKQDVLAHPHRDVRSY